MFCVPYESDLNVIENKIPALKMFRFFFIVETNAQIFIPGNLEPAQKRSYPSNIKEYFLDSN